MLDLRPSASLPPPVRPSVLAAHATLASPAPKQNITAPPPAARIPAEPSEFNPLRILGLFFGLLYLGVKVSFISEAIQYMSGIRTFLIPLSLLPAFLLILSSGGLVRVFRHKATILMALFAVWAALCIPTSHWPGGSFDKMGAYFRYDLVTLLIPAGLIVTWKEMRRFGYVLALASFGVLFAVRFCSKVDGGGRLSLAFEGTIGNANDLAAILLLLLPFLAFCLLDSSGPKFFRFLCLPTIAYALYTILGTASRGALVALAAGTLFWFLRATMRQRLFGVILIPLLALPALVLLPDSAFNRLFNLFGESHVEADESSASRSYLFRQSLVFTLKKPVFGVGPSQFSNYEGHVSVSSGVRGNWHETHCSWTQISSETGIPGILFYASAIFTAGLLVLRVNRRARQLKAHDLANFSFYFLLAMVMYFTSITFLSNGYSTLQPMIVSAAVALHFVAARTFAAHSLTQTANGGGQSRAVTLPPLSPLAPL